MSPNCSERRDVPVEWEKGGHEGDMHDEDPAWNELWEAVRRNRVRDWLRAGGDPNLRFKARGGVTPLWIAVRLHKTRAVRDLLAAGADASPERHGDESLFTSELPYTGMVRRPDGSVGINLLHAALRGVRDEFPDDETWARQHGGDAPSALISLLVNAGVPVDESDNRGRTPLWRACARTACACASMASIESVLALLNAGASAARPDNEGVTPLHLVAASPLWNPDYPSSGFEAISLLEKLFKRLLEDGSATEARNRSGRTPLLCAVEADNPVALTLLLKAGAAPGVVDAQGHCAYHATARPSRPQDNLSRIAKRRLACLIALLETGAPIPAGLPDNSLFGRTLNWLREHVSDEAELPHPDTICLPVLIPLVVRSESWWQRFAGKRGAFGYHKLVLQNPTCPESVKSLFRMALA